MVIRKSQLIRFMVKLASLPLRLAGAALLPEQSVWSLSLYLASIGQDHTVIISSICFDHFLIFSECSYT